MDISFNDNELRKLYETGKSRKYKLQPSIVRRFTRVVDMLKAINRYEEIFCFNNLRYKKLEGTETESVRINDKYRLLIRIDKEKPLITCGVIEITNHYSKIRK